MAGKDFGAYKLGTISGQIYEDLNANGTKDGGETGLSGRTVYLDANGNGAYDAGETTATTDGSGNYAFASVPLGTARVRQALPGGWTQSAPSGPYTLSVVSQSAFTNKDLGAYTTGSISGRVYNDASFDGGAYNAGGGDSGLSGRSVYLDTNHNGVKDSGETSVTTDGSGNYSFTGLAPGAYTVRTATPALVACSFPSPCSYGVTVTSQSSATAKDFGTYTGGTVSGNLFEDLDADGAAKEAGEGNVAGQTVYVDANDNGALDSGETTTTTDASGNYTFSGLTAITQHIRLKLSSGWTCDSPASPCKYDVAVTSGSTTTGKDFGVHHAGTIAGHLWTDSTGAGTGVQIWGDNDEPGRTVYLDANDNGTLDGGETTTTTDDSGNYTFSGVQPGAYVVREDLPSGWVCSTPTPCRRAVTLVSGQASTGN